MQTNFDFLKLPWEIQAALASGYVAYMIAYAVLRGRHSTIDTAFITLVFSLIATVILSLMMTFGPPLAIVTTVVGCCVSGLIWRKWGRGTYRWSMRKLDISWANDDPSTLDTLCGDSTNYLTAIAIQLDNGQWLRCDNTEKFRDAPHGPALIGPAGDVALYLTHEEEADGTQKELETVSSHDYGDLLTYVPASRIRILNLRYKSSCSSKVVAEASSQ